MTCQVIVTELKTTIERFVPESTRLRMTNADESGVESGIVVVALNGLCHNYVLLLETTIAREQNPPKVDVDKCVADLKYSRLAKESEHGHARLRSYCMIHTGTVLHSQRQDPFRACSYGRRAKQAVACSVFRMSTSSPDAQRLAGAGKSVVVRGHVPMGDTILTTCRFLYLVVNIYTGHISRRSPHKSRSSAPFSISSLY